MAKMTYAEGHNSSYGDCWIEGDGATYWVYLMGGKSKKGPFSSLKDAKEVYSKYCPE
jgi:hypothetical protein